MTYLPNPYPSDAKHAKHRFPYAAREQTRARCNRNTDSIVCPFHEPLAYPHYAAQHRGASSLLDATLPSQRRG